MPFLQNSTTRPRNRPSQSSGLARILRGFSIGAAAAVLTCCLLTFAAPSQASSTGPTTGRASWYGTTAHGKPTANGEIYDRDALTAAHKKLPFGTVVRVYNLRNGKHVLLRINDRGPFVKGRIIDVSHRAAGILQMKQSGVVPVALEVVTNKQGVPLNNDNCFYLHIADETGSLRSRVLAMQLEETLQAPVLPLRSGKKTGKTPHYSLCVGPYSSFNEAEEASATLARQGHPPIRIVEGSSNILELPKHRPPAGGKSTAESNTAEAAEAVDYFRTAIYSPLYFASHFIQKVDTYFLSTVKELITQ